MRHYRRAPAAQQAARGTDHPDRAATLDNYADILVMSGRGAGAARLKARAAKIRAKAGKGAQRKSHLPEPAPRGGAAPSGGAISKVLRIIEISV